jgi:hypothetical protein
VDLSDALGLPEQEAAMRCRCLALIESLHVATGAAVGALLGSRKRAALAGPLLHALLDIVPRLIENAAQINVEADKRVAADVLNRPKRQLREVLAVTLGIPVTNLPSSFDCEFVPGAWRLIGHEDRHQDRLARSPGVKGHMAVNAGLAECDHYLIVSRVRDAQRRRTTRVRAASVRDTLQNKRPRKRGLSCRGAEI